MPSPSGDPASPPGPTAATPASPGGSPEWDVLLDLPGIEFVWTSASATERERTLYPDSMPERPTAPLWARLQMALSERMAQELDLGQPRVMMIVHDQKLLVIGLAEDVQAAVVLQDPASAGIALVRVRQWIEQSGDRSKQ